MLEKIYQTITRHNLIENGDSVVVAVSGGPDSTCLLHALYSLSGKLNIRIFAVHINHMLRGAEADADEAYVGELCRRLGIPLHACSFDIRQIAKEMGISLEEAGREMRYRALNDFADRVGAVEIAIAHNKDDQAETVLMHIMRGSGLMGLVGMEYRRGRIIRPMLDIGRNEIEAYCAEHDLKPRTDSSNLKSDFTRNRVRLELVPFINKRFDMDITDSVCRMSSLIACDNDYIEKHTAEALGMCIETSGTGYIHLKLSKLAGLHPALKGRVLRGAVRHVKGDLKGIESVHIEDISSLASRARTGSVVQLPDGIRAGISYDLLMIYINKEGTEILPFNKPLIIPGITEVSERCSFISAALETDTTKVDKYGKIEYNSFVQFFDYDKLKEGINIRNRCEGDVFRPFRSNGTKKLKEYFIDNKIPRDLRDVIPLVASGKEIVWIIGYKISDKFKVTENTKSVLKLEYNRRVL